MSDPLSVTAGVVGIVIPALHGTRLLIDDLQQLKDAPKTVDRVLTDVRSVATALELLQGVEARDWQLLGPGVNEHSKATIASCTQACELFRSDLRRWTKHSEEGRLIWWDRAKVGFFKQKQIKAISEQLVHCQLAVNSVTNIATLYSSVRHGHITEEIKNTIITRQAEVTRAIDTTNTQLVRVEDRLQELNLSSDEDEANISESGKTEAARQLQEELNAIKASQKLLSELLAKSQAEAIATAVGKQTQSNTVTFGSQNSGFQAGVINSAVSGLNFGAK